MFKKIYKPLVESRAQTYYVAIEKAINIIDTCNGWCDDSLLDTTDSVISVTQSYFKRQIDDKTVYDLFLDNLHIHVSIGKKEKIYSIRLKKKDDNWTIPMTETGCDYSHPSNDYYEVYVWYEVPVLDITTTDGYVYNEGTWNKVVYKEMAAFFKRTQAMTKVSEFNACYR